MPHSGWLTSPLTALSHRQPKVCCVLSGGGSRASFQLGALDYLYRNDPDFAPSIFVGASAGSILASGLAQDMDRDAQHRFTISVMEIWRGLREPAQMFTPRPWMVRAMAEAPGWLDMVASHTPAPEPAPRTFPKLSFLRTSGPSTPDPRGHHGAGPLEMALQPDEEFEPEWSLGTLAQLFSNVGKLPRIGGDLLAIHNGMERTKSMYRPGPVLLQLLDPEVFAPARVRDSGTTLRIAMVALESGELRFMREDGALVDRRDTVFDHGPHPLATGVLASCAIPAVFRPVPLGTETYVDGGVRDNLPVQLAMEHLGADKTYLISSKGIGVPTRQSMRDADLFAIVMRSTEILIDEAGRDELEYAATTGATVIQPELDVHDAMSVDPGLIAINIDYGWLRAAERHLGLEEAHTSRHRRIIALRVRCLRLENEFLEARAADDVLPTLTRAKSEMRAELESCDPRALPEGAELWSSTFEKHVVEPEIIPPWIVDEDVTR
ncbi:MAG: patatin-like phospholipase family protein [Propionibacteriaceae bacterium]|nr:patatin-like phospholipase family protein [Propionibacteriaceae bacterium]